MIGRAAFALAAAGIALAIAITTGAERLSDSERRLRFEVTAPTPAVEAIWRERLRGRDVSITRDPGATARLEVTGTPEEADALRGALTLSGAMEMRWVAHDTPTARAWFRAMHRDGAGDPATGVRAYTDGWFHEESGREHADWFLAAEDPDALARAIDGLRQAADPALHVPAELEVGFEHVIPTPYSGEERAQPAYHRTYLLERASIVTDADVASAHVDFDPNTLLPQVSVTFTPDGARAFGDATATRAGHKLAILVDGRVVSAPIVQTAIRGGRVTITVAGADRRAQEVEAGALAAALGARAGRLPDGLEARLVGTEDPVTGRWLTRLVVALVAGLLALLAAAAIARRTDLAPVPLVAVPPPLTAPLGGAGRALVALVVTFGLPALLVLVAPRVLLPGLGPEVGDLFGAGVGDDARANLGIFALGIAPLASAFWLAELIALLVPAWRRARLGTPAGRRAVDRLALALTFGLALLQAILVLRWLEDANAHGLAVLADGVVPRVALVATLVAGVLVHAVAADLITRHGLANGVVVLLATPVALGFLDARTPAGPDDPIRLVLALTAALALAALALARLRPARGGASPGGRLPWGGVVPAVLPGILVALAALPAPLWPASADWLGAYWRHAPWIDVALAVPIIGALAWHHRAARSGPALHEPRAHLVPALLSLGFVAALLLAPLLIDPPYRAALSAINAAVLGVALVELYAGLAARLRLAAPVTVHRVHDVDRADALADALADAGIVHAVAGVHARAVLRLFGGFCPIELRVAAADADRARALLAERDAAIEAAARLGIARTAS